MNVVRQLQDDGKFIAPKLLAQQSDLSLQLEKPVDQMAFRVISNRDTQIFKTYGRRAEWLVVREGLTLEKVFEALEQAVPLEMLTKWSAKFSWQEKRRRYESKPTTPTRMVYDLLYTELLEANQKQMSGERLTKEDIEKLDKLTRMYKQTGLPFCEQVVNVMRVYLHYIDQYKFDKEDDRALQMKLVKGFITDVENGYIHPEE